MKLFVPLQPPLLRTVQLGLRVTVEAVTSLVMAKKTGQAPLYVDMFPLHLFMFGNLFWLSDKHYVRNH